MMEFVDATLFMGMNSADPAVRIACKNFFVERFAQTVAMSDDQAGKCDRIIWKQFDRITQDTYYPFMDQLRTDMNIQCLEYEESDLDAAQTLASHNGSLSTPQRLTLGMVQARSGKLVTVDASLHDLNATLPTDQQLPLAYPETGAEKPFPDPVLEKAYQASLVLQVEALN